MNFQIEKIIPQNYMLQTNFDFIVNSSTGLNRTAGYDRFDTRFTKVKPKIPANAKNLRLSVLSATIWNSPVDIHTGVNDKFYFSQGASNYTLTLDQGLYNLDEINSEIDRLLVAAGAASGLISFQPDFATEKVIATFTLANCQVTWSAGSFWYLL